MLQEIRDIIAVFRRLRRDRSLLAAAVLCPCHLILLLVVVAGVLPCLGLLRYRVPIIAVGTILFLATALWPVWRQQRFQRGESDEGRCSR